MFNFLKQEIMKKLLLLAPIAALALASCSNDEQIAQSPALNAQEVTFRPVVNGTTRTVITDANFTKFTVEAAITNGSDYAFWEAATSDETTSENHGQASNSITAEVTKNATSGKWELIGGKNYYWSSKNAEASFVGYNAKGSVAIGNAIADQKDILVAYNKGAASSFDNGVPMLFRHVLSQIVIKADNSDADIRQIKVAGVRLHNINSESTLTLPSVLTTSGDFDWSTTTYYPWGTLSIPTKYTYYKAALSGTNNDEVQDAITLNASAQEITFDGPALLLPQTVAAATDLTSENAGGKAYIDILVQVQNLESGVTEAKKAIFPEATTVAAQKYAWVAVPVDIAWNPGYKYTYVLHFSKDGIGKVSPDGGEGGEEPTEPGKEIVDNPVPLYFTVTIDEWNDAADTEKNL